MVVDLMDRQRSGGDGTPAMGTVVFFDVVGSTDTMARLEDEGWRDALEEARDQLDPLIDFIIDTVRDLGGTVARVQGDGVMAVFGAPKPLEKHAVNACAAALKVRDHFRDRMLMLGPGQFAAIRIGIHFGRILIRNRKHDIGGVLDIVGHATHRAKKVEMLCPPNAALVTHETLQLAGAAVDARHWEAGVFELVAVAPHHDLDHQFPADLLEPFVGRAEILTRLIANMGDAYGRKAQTLALVGAAGLGKSRILFELSRKVESQGVRVVEMRGHAVHRLTPFAPVKPLVAALLQRDADSLAAHPLPPSLTQGIQELIGAPADEEWNTLDGPSRRRIMIEAACMLVARAATKDPLLIVADDAQDFDAETHDVIARLKTLTAEAQIAMVVTARTEAALPPVVDDVIRLDLLNEDQSWQFARSTAAAAPIADADMAQAVRNAAGNPLFLQSLIRHLRSGKKGDTTPAELASLVQARMDELSDPARTVVWAVAVLRANVTKSTLAATVDIDEATLEPLLVELERHDLIAIDSGGVRFRHDLFRGAVDGLLVRRQRNELHRRSRLALELQPQTAELLDQLTYHADEAEDFVGALAYVLKSVQLAKRTSSLKTIRALYDRAKALKDKAGIDAVPALAAVTIDSLDALQQSGDREYRSALEFVADYAARTGDLMNEGLAHAHLALVCWMKAEHDKGLEHARAALAIADRLPHPQSLALRALAQPHLANIEHARGNIDRAIALHEEIVTALEGEYEKTTLGRMIVPSVRSRAFAAWFLIDRGNFERAQAHITRGEEILRAIEQPYSRVLLNAARGYLALRTGRRHDAIAPLEQARAFCLEKQFFVMEACVTGWLATALTEIGDYQKAREHAGHSIDTELYTHGGRYTWVFVHNAMADALFFCGDTPKAIKTAETSLSIARASEEPIQIAQALFVLGRLLARSGDVERGLAEVRAALVLAERHHLDPLAHDCRRVLEEFA
jgi:class 3 adenylate cyclase/tetratricopeptide (TPR) repeat protein